MSSSSRERNVAKTARIPVTLVTGFLGSGKTTLINAVLQDPAFAGTLVIVNEFGEVGLDHALITNAQDDVVLLDSGCLCCAASGSLRDTLIDIFARGKNDALPTIHHIIVETSGLANPGPLVATLIGDSALKPRCSLAQVLTLVDPLNGLASLERYTEARQQIAFADTLVITKADQASAEDLTRVHQALTSLNDKAPRLYWERGKPAAMMFSSSTQNTVGNGPAPDIWVERLMKSASGASPAFTLRHRSTDELREMPTHGTAYTGITTSTLQFGAKPVDWPVYSLLINSLTSRYGRKLLRCKGVLTLGPEGTPKVVQGVQGYFAPPENASPSITLNDKAFLVCIMDGVAPLELLDFVHTLPGLPEITMSRPQKDA